MPSSRQCIALICAFACALQAAAIPFPAVPKPPAGKAAELHPAVPKPPAGKAAELHPAVPKPPAQSAAAVQSTTSEQAFFDRCPQGDDWIRYKDSCYRHYETSQYWYLAELECRNHGGHLVSIADQAENAFVAKLTYCRSAWTGKFAVNAAGLSDPASYQWTDGSNSGQYHAHNFSSITSMHQPLISVSNLKWHNNLYHSKDQFVCEVAARQHGNSSSNCPAGWKSLNGFCYFMPDFATTFIEATFYCSGRAASLVSVYTAQELRALSLLDLGSDGCPPEVWIGLIKVNPCRIDMFTGQPICYKWSDRMTEFYNGFPAWHPGHPDTGEQVNCVLLQDRAMKTVQCYDRHRFVCKKPASA